MKKRLQPLPIMLLLMGCFKILAAQGPEKNSIISNPQLPVPLYIYAGSATEPMTWYLEENAISNEFGVRIVALDCTTKSAFFSKIEQIAAKGEFSTLSFSAIDNRIHLSNGSEDPQSLSLRLISLLND